MTKQEQALFKALKRLRDAVWDYGDIDPETVDVRLNRAYMAADGLIRQIEQAKAASRRGKSQPSPQAFGGEP